MATEPKKTSLRKFFANPLVGAIGTAASVVSLVLAIYFYIEGNATRELVYTVDPARAVVVRTGQVSRLAVTIDGQSINSDISVAQVAFWNRGEASIRGEHVLQPLVIETSDSAPIVDVSIRHLSRSAVALKLDKAELAKGRLTVRWAILETDDGAQLQLTYLGDTEIPISASAIIEGQRRIASVATSRPTGVTRALLLANFLLYAGMGAFLLVSVRRAHLYRSFALRWRIRILLLLMVVALILGAFAFAAWSLVMFVAPSSPPF